MKIDVKKCARCGRNHRRVEFFELARPCKHFTHWAPCPTNGQPILLATVIVFATLDRKKETVRRCETFARESDPRAWANCRHADRMALEAAIDHLCLPETKKAIVDWVKTHSKEVFPGWPLVKDEDSLVGRMFWPARTKPTERVEDRANQPRRSSLPLHRHD